MIALGLIASSAGVLVGGDALVAGTAFVATVLADRAAIFIDGRYTLAVRSQVDTEAFVPHQIPEQSPEAWIAENLPKDGKLGFDPWLQTVDGHERFARACQRAGGEFVPVDSNPVDAVWSERPPAHRNPGEKSRWTWPGG